MRLHCVFIHKKFNIEIRVTLWNIKFSNTCTRIFSVRHLKLNAWGALGFLSVLTCTLCDHKKWVQIIGMADACGITHTPRCPLGESMMRFAFFVDIGTLNGMQTSLNSAQTGKIINERPHAQSVEFTIKLVSPLNLQGEKERKRKRNVRN